MAFVGVCVRAATRGPTRGPTRGARRVCAWRACGQTPVRDDDDADDDDAVSRRVFVVGTGVTTVATFLAWLRFLVGDDDKARVLKRVRQRFPNVFPSSEETLTRRALDAAFARWYFDGLADVAVGMRLLKRDALYGEEQQVRKRAYKLFFSDAQSVREDLGNERWFNFVVYARLHVIATRTSAASRVRFSARHADHMLRALQTQPLSLDANAARLYPQRWLGAIENVLSELVSLGFIGDFTIEGFDGGAGSSWMEEGRSTLTVYAKQPVTMQAAQLVGEEQYEQLSPKLSSLLSAFLNKASIANSFEDYYLDDVYRPDAADYRPTQLATQFDISLSP